MWWRRCIVEAMEEADVLMDGERTMGIRMGHGTAGVMTRLGSCAARMKSSALIGSGILFTTVWSGPAFFPRHLPGNKCCCKHCTSHRSGPAAGLTLMLLSWKWELGCSPATRLLMQSGQIVIPQPSVDTPVVCLWILIRVFAGQTEIKMHSVSSVFLMAENEMKV